MFRETLCTVRVAVASRLYSSSTVIKILPMSAGTMGVCSGGQPNVCSCSADPSAPV